jgi:hypothetical protein
MAKLDITTDEGICELVRCSIANANHHYVFAADAEDRAIAALLKARDDGLARDDWAMHNLLKTVLLDGAEQRPWEERPW